MALIAVCVCVCVCYQHEAGSVSSPIVLTFVTGSFHEKKSMMISESGMFRRTYSADQHSFFETPLFETRVDTVQWQAVEGRDEKRGGVSHRWRPP